MDAGNLIQAFGIGLLIGLWLWPFDNSQDRGQRGPAVAPRPYE